MGAVTGLIGLGGGAAGTSFQGPQGVTAGQLQTGYNQSQDALTQQQALLAALQGVNGIGNQQSTFQAQQALAQQQQATAGQYQNLANGVGPNPAQAQFAQNTAANVAQQAALQAGQRGAAQNVGLIARQAGQQGAAMQQQAAGQAATLQAQQQIAGLQGLTAQQQAIGQTQQNAAQIAAQQTANQVNQANQIAASRQQQYQSLLGLQGNINTGNAALANTQLQGQQGILGGALQGAGMALGAAGARGGEVKRMADGGDSSTSTGPASAGPQSKFVQFLQGATKNPQDDSNQPMTSSGQLRKGTSKATQGLLTALMKPAAATGGAGAPGMLAAPMPVAKGGDMRAGGPVRANSPKQKAVAKGDDYANDKIPAVLSEHEIVLPRSVTLSDDPVGNAAKFVAQTLAKRRGKR